MAARRFPSDARSEFPRARFVTVLLSITTFLVSTFATLAVGQGVNYTGRWTPSHEMGRIAIHLTLLPGDSTQYHSEIMWWTGLNEEQGPFDGGMWGWQPLGYDCSSFPGTNMLQDLTVPTPPGAPFCGSNSHIATAGGTKLFVAGGTQPGTENGVRRVFLFNPRSRTWSLADSMSEERWYATSTALSDSRQLVLSGTKDLSLDFFGGLRNSEIQPRDRSLFRYGIGNNGHPEVPMSPGSGAQWPTPRRGHTMVRNGAWRVFGGRDSVQYFDQYWELNRVDSTFKADFDYVWTPRSIQGAGPAARWAHTAVVTPDSAAEMIIFGGIRKTSLGDSVATDDVWRLWFDHNPSVNRLVWSLVTIQNSPESTDLPHERSGHLAFYHGPSRRMLVFGGRGSPTGTPSDNALYALDFDDASFNTATWHKLSAVGPSARYNHAGAYDPGWVHKGLSVGAPDSSYAFVFGGRLADGGDDGTLWALRVEPSPAWRVVNWLQGTAPSPRSGHTMSTVSRRLYVFGGRPADDTVYVARAEPFNPDEQRTWSVFQQNAPALTGHTAILEDVQWSRIPEIYDPTTDEWTRLETAPKRLNWYPQTFVCSADTVFVAGPDELTYKLSLGSLGDPHWQQFPSASSNFLGGSAVMFKPGQVMKCGSRDIEVSTGGDAVGTTKRVNLNDAAAQWQTSANMLPRVNHNLVLLPNGKVLVVGGTARGGADTTGQHRPQIWDPNAGGGAGAWFGNDTLAIQPLTRDYHSTALLLPDGRVMSAGGNGDTLFDSYEKVEIFCPPYLFAANGNPAVRPGIVEAPRLVRYGATHAFCRISSDSISKVSLIRPGAATHGFDENQRFIPLNFNMSAGTPPQLTVTFPSSPVDAPPGDYLLFVLKDQDVPSIAKWVRLVSSSDSTAPAAVSNLTVDVAASNSLHLTWTAPGDDGTSGTAARVDLRYSRYPITADNFCQATTVDSVISPGSGGAARSYGVNYLASCADYYLAMKYWDEVNNVSVFGNVATGKTLCGGGGCCFEGAHVARDGGTSAHGSVRSEAGVAGTKDAVTPTAATPEGPTTGIVVEARTGTAGLDLDLFPIADGFEGHAVASDGGVLLQQLNGAGAWTDRVSYELPADSRFALCAPEQPTRWVILAPCAVAAVLPAVGGESGAWRLDSARQSTLGDVTAALADSAPRLGAGDTLFAHYATTSDTSGLSKGWMLMLDRFGGSAPSVRAKRKLGREGQSLPAAFALFNSQPNPFADQATIRFALPVASRVRIEVFDLLGRKVRSLADRKYEAGEHEVVWDRRTARGALAGPGLYFYRMEAGEFRAKRAMMVVP